MDGQHTHAEPFRFSDPRQQRIHDRLSLIGPGPVDFYRAASSLMALLGTPFPGLKDAERLRNQVPNNLVTLGYFFDKLTNAAWLQPLRDAHFFQHPPDLLHDHDEGLVSCPPWPASRYLVRMASVAEAQETVLDIALQIGETENICVYEDLAEIALALPATFGAQLVPQTQRGLASPYHSLLPQKLGALISHLAKGGQEGAALDLARALLMVLPDPQAEDASYPLLLEPRARVDAWRYDRLLQTHMPDLVAAVGVEALRLACELLETALVLSRRRRGGDENDPEDYSADWRPAIEDSSQNQLRLYPVKNSLVSAVRNAAEQLAKADIACVPALIEILEQRPWYVFQRMALHLLRRFPQAPTAPVLIAEHLTDHRHFEARSLRYEYVLLGREHFAHLSSDEQATILH